MRGKKRQKSNKQTNKQTNKQKVIAKRTSQARKGIFNSHWWGGRWVRSRRVGRVWNFVGTTWGFQSYKISFILNLGKIFEFLRHIFEFWRHVFDFLAPIFEHLFFSKDVGGIRVSSRTCGEFRHQSQENYSARPLWHPKKATTFLRHTSSRCDCPRDSN